MSMTDADLNDALTVLGELFRSARWCRTHDPSDGFRQMLQQALSALGLEVDDV